MNQFFSPVFDHRIIHRNLKYEGNMSNRSIAQHKEEHTVEEVHMNCSVIQ